jgi:hypothetical protein
MQIDIKDYIDEASTRVLVQELQKRPTFEFLSGENIKQRLEQAEKLDKLSTLEEVKQILNLKPYATKAEIINEIEEL